MDISKLDTYKKTKGLNLVQLSLDDRVELTIIALEEFADLFFESNADFDFDRFYYHAKSIVQCGMRFMQELLAKGKLTIEKHDQIVIGIVMLVKHYQHKWAQSKHIIVNDLLMQYFYENFLSDETLKEVTTIACKTLQANKNSEEDYITTIQELGHHILQQKSVPIDESAFLTGGENQKITALSVILKQILQNNKVVVKPYHAYAIGQTVTATENEAYWKEAITLHNAKVLYAAAAQGDLAKINDLLDAETPANRRSGRFLPYMTALDMTACHGHCDVFKTLLLRANFSEEDIAHGIKNVIVANKAEAEDEQQERSNKFKPLLDYFLTTNYINVRTAKGNTPLHLALIHDNFDYAIKLMRAGADINATNKEGETPLLLVAQSPHLAADIKLDSNQDDQDYLISNPAARIMQFLLERGANPNLGSNTENKSVLHCVIHKGNATIVTILLPHIIKANDAQGEPWYVAYMHAAMEGVFNPKVLDILISNGADLSYPAKESYFNDVNYAFIFCLAFNCEEKEKKFSCMLDRLNYLLMHGAKLPANNESFMESLKDCFMTNGSYSLFPSQKPGALRCSKELHEKFLKTTEAFARAVESSNKNKDKPSAISMFKNIDVTSDKEKTKNAKKVQFQQDSNTFEHERTNCCWK